jgi:hypothetical protein
LLLQSFFAFGISISNHHNHRQHPNQSHTHTKDSFYEYMLKLWLQGGKTEDKYRDMYDEAIEGMHNVLLQHSNSPAKLAYIAKKMSGKNGKLVHEFEHLECFMGGEYGCACTCSDMLVCST